MTTLTLNPFSQTDYEEKRYQLIEQLEESGDPKETIYNDGGSAKAGYLTMGVGFNVSQRAILETVLETGFGLTRANQSFFKVGKDFASLSNALLGILSGTHTNAEIAGIQTQLNAKMVEYTTTKTKFEFETLGEKTADQKIRETFDVIAIAKELELSNILTAIGYNDTSNHGPTTNVKNMDYSMERLALISLQYNNNPSNNPIISATNNLGQALGQANRTRAWYEIRYASNSDIVQAKRRYIESQLFGLFPVNLTALQLQSKATEIISFFSQDAYLNDTNHYPNNLAHMLVYEKLYQSKVSTAQGDADAANLGIHIDSWREIFKPIAGYLLDNYLDNPISNLSGVLFAKNNHFNGDVNLGLDIGGIIKPQDFDVTGKDKNDLLIAIDDTKDNTLNGGKGDDFLIGAALVDTMEGGDDNDILVGNAGDDILKGGKGYDFLYGGIGKDNLDGGIDADHLYGGDGTEVDVLNGGDGNDILEGGTGIDKYIFSGTFGRDMIKDTDGGIYFGADESSAIQLTQLTQTTKDSII
ncbi:MAG: calcium-binding protein, partial [Pseudomonadota bacterium]